MEVIQIGLFRKKNTEQRADGVMQFEDTLLKALLSNTIIDKEKALQIPIVQACVNKIAGKVAQLPIKLYKKENGKVIEVTDDERLRLLNDDTGDTLNSNEFWKSMLEDYYFGKGAFAYICKDKGEYKSLHYVDEKDVMILVNQDKIFKDYQIVIDGQKYYPFDFLKIKRKTKNGAENIPLQKECNTIFQVAYNTLIFENFIVQKGGNKRGVIESKDGIKLSSEAINSIKEAWKNLYSTNTDNCIVLNGASFKETSNSAIEMQLNENKKTNSSAISELFGFPITILAGGATENDEKQFKSSIIELLTTIETALDKDLLREKEKGLFYFAFDTRELTRGSTKERYEAYEIGLRNKFLQPDEIRKEEDLAPLGFNYITLGLGDVLVNPATMELYTPNTNQTAQLKGGEKN